MRWKRAVWGAGSVALLSTVVLTLALAPAQLFAAPSPSPPPPPGVDGGAGSGGAGGCGPSTLPTPTGGGLVYGLLADDQNRNFAALLAPGDSIMGIFLPTTIGSAAIGYDAFQVKRQLTGKDLAMDLSHDFGDVALSLTLPGAPTQIFRAAHVRSTIHAQCQDGVPAVSATFQAMGVGLDGVESDLTLDSAQTFALAGGGGSVTLNEITVSDYGSPASLHVQVNAIHAHSDPFAFADVVVGYGELFVVCRPGQ
jgi:hypothetical protein